MTAIMPKDEVQKLLDGIAAMKPRAKAAMPKTVAELDRLARSLLAARDEIERLRVDRDALSKQLEDENTGWEKCYDQQRDRANAAEAERNRLAIDNARLAAQVETYGYALEELKQWADAYPTKVFPEPDLARAAAILSQGGMSLDVVSASNMRHVLTRVAQITRAALAAMTPAERADFDLTMRIRGAAGDIAKAQMAERQGKS